MVSRCNLMNRAFGVSYSRFRRHRHVFLVSGRPSQFSRCHRGRRRLAAAAAAAAIYRQLITECEV